MVAIVDPESGHSSGQSLLNKKWIISGAIVAGAVIIAGIGIIAYFSMNPDKQAASGSTPRPITTSPINISTSTTSTLPIVIPSKNSERGVFLEPITLSNVGAAIDRVRKFRNSTKATTAIDEDTDLKNPQEKDAMKFAMDNQGGVLELMEKYLKGKSKDPITDQQRQDLKNGIKKLFPKITDAEFNQLNDVIDGIPKDTSSGPADDLSNLPPDVLSLAHRKFKSTEQIDVFRADPTDIQKIKEVCTNKKTDVDKVSTLKQVCESIDKIANVVTIGKKDFTATTPTLLELETILTFQNDAKCMEVCKAQSVTDLLNAKFVAKVDPTELITKYNAAKKKAVDNPTIKDELEKSAEIILELRMFLNIPSTESRFSAPNDTSSMIIINDLKNDIINLSRQSLDGTILKDEREKHDANARKYFGLLKEFDPSIPKNYEDFVKAVKAEMEYKDAVTTFVNALKSKIDDNTWLTTDVRQSNQAVLDDIKQKLENLLAVTPTFVDTTNDLINTTASPRAPKSADDMLKTLIGKFIVPHLMTKVKSDETKQLCGVTGVAVDPKCDAIAKLIPQIKSALGTNIPGENGRLQKINDGPALTLYLKIMSYHDILKMDFGAANKLDLSSPEIPTLLGRIEGLELAVIQQVNIADDQVPATNNLQFIKTDANRQELLAIHTLLTTPAGSTQRDLEGTIKVQNARTLFAAVVLDAPLAAYMARPFQVNLNPDLKVCISHFDKIIVNPDDNINVVLYTKLKNLKNPDYNVTISDQTEIDKDADLKCLDELLIFNDVALANEANLFIHFAQKCRLFRLPDFNSIDYSIKERQIYAALKKKVPTKFTLNTYGEPGGSCSIASIRSRIKEEVEFVKKMNYTEDYVQIRLDDIVQFYATLEYDYDPAGLDLKKGANLNTIKAKLAPQILSGALKKFPDNTSPDPAVVHPWWKKLWDMFTPEATYINSLPDVIRNGHADVAEFEKMLNDKDNGVLAQSVNFETALYKVYNGPHFKNVLRDNPDQSIGLEFFNEVNDLLEEYGKYGRLSAPFDVIVGPVKTGDQMLKVLQHGIEHVLCTEMEGLSVILKTDIIDNPKVQMWGAPIHFHEKITEKTREYRAIIDKYHPTLNVFKLCKPEKIFDLMKSDSLDNNGWIPRLEKLVKFPELLSLNYDLYYRLNKIMEFRNELVDWYGKSDPYKTKLGYVLELLQQKSLQQCDVQTLELTKLLEKDFKSFASNVALQCRSPANRKYTKADNHLEVRAYNPNDPEAIIFKYFREEADASARSGINEEQFNTHVEALVEKYGDKKNWTTIRDKVYHLDPHYLGRFAELEILLNSPDKKREIAESIVKYIDIQKQKGFSGIHLLKEGFSALRAFLSAQIKSSVDAPFRAYLTYLLAYLDMEEQRFKVKVAARNIHVDLAKNPDISSPLYPQGRTITSYFPSLPTFGSRSLHFDDLWNKLDDGKLSLEEFESTLRHPQFTMDGKENGRVDFFIIYQQFLNLSVRAELALNNYLNLAGKPYKDFECKMQKFHRTLTLIVASKLFNQPSERLNEVKELLKNHSDVDKFVSGLQNRGGSIDKLQSSGGSIDKFTSASLNLLPNRDDIEDDKKPFVDNFVHLKLELEVYKANLKHQIPKDVEKFKPGLTSPNKLSPFLSNMHQTSALQEAVDSITGILPPRFDQFKTVLPELEKYAEQKYKLDDDDESDPPALMDRREKHLHAIMADLPIPILAANEIKDARLEPCLVKLLNIGVRVKYELDTAFSNELPADPDHIIEPIRDRYLLEKVKEEANKPEFIMQMSLMEGGELVDSFLDQLLSDIAQASQIQKDFMQIIPGPLATLAPSPDQLKKINWPDSTSQDFIKLKARFDSMPLNKLAEFEHFLAKHINADWNKTIEESIVNHLNQYIKGNLDNSPDLKGFHDLQVRKRAKLLISTP